MVFRDKYEMLCRINHKLPVSQEMADTFGVRKSAITSWKKGSIPRKATLERIAEFFHVTTEYLLDDEMDEFPRDLYLTDRAAYTVGQKDMREADPERTSSERRALERYQKLDDIDQARTISYMDGLLAGEKYDL